MQREKRGSVDEVWRLGILIEASSTLPPLKDHLLTVIHYNVPPASIPIQSDAIALCKVSLLDTFEHANDYTGNEGYPLNAADESRCRYPSVLIAHTLNGPGDLVNIEGDLVDIQCPEDLQAYVGTGHPLKPTIFLVSHDFLATYGFFSKENVWFREITPLPLDQVILVPTGDAMDSLSDSQIEEVVRELYEKCQNEPVVMQQNFIFIFKSKHHGVLLTFHVLETQPVCQGRITERTTIALLPPEDRSPSPDRKLTGKESEEEFPPRGRFVIFS